MSAYEEEAARLKAEMDQLVSTSADMTRAVAAFHAGLRNEGFSEQSALRLTVTWLKAAMRIGGSS